MLEFENTSIRKKLIIIQLATALLAVLICCFFFVYRDIRTFKDAEVRTNYSIAQVIGFNAIPALEFMDPEAAEKMLLSLQNNPSVLNAVILDQKGREFARYDRTGEEAFSFTGSEEEKENTNNPWEKFIITYPIVDKEQLGTVVIRAELTGFRQILLDYLIIAGLILLASLAIALLVSNILQRSITQRLLGLVNRTKEVADKNDYSLRAKEYGNDEIATLATAYNRMLDQIERMQKALKNANADLEKRVKIRTAELEAANQELERFVYVASHDLQEPLRTISNYAGLLQDKYSGGLDATGNKYLGSLMRSAGRMRALINDLLEFSRLGKNAEIKDVDTGHVLQEVISLLDAVISENGVTITSTSLPVLKGNEVELKQLFQNLLSNAIKFRKPDVAPEVNITVEDRGNEYLFAFKDNGIGIEPEYKERIFIVFQRLHAKHEYPGTGIGLATCQKIVTLHKGKIWVDSQLGNGSTFYFTLSKNL